MPTADAVIQRILNDPAGLSVLLVHAHPDDDTLSTGPLAAWLTSHGATVDLVTCTRGERGEVVPGVLPPTISREQLIRARGVELATACQTLGIRNHWFLGIVPWRAEGLADRRYGDSGMVWVTPSLAGPAPDADENSLTLSDLDDEVADLIAGLGQYRYDAIVSYDNGGGYGHPDHVRAHEIVAAATRQTGLPFIKIVSREDACPGAADDPNTRWLDVDDPELDATVVAALRCFKTQLSVVDDGDEHGLHIRHVGGQVQEIPGRVGLLG